MNARIGRIVRWGVWALPVWAALLFVGTITHQPDAATDFAGFAAYVTTQEFLVSHIVASILGAGIGSVGVAALAMHLSDTRAAGRAFVGMALTILGNTLVTAIFGIAAFAQPAMGRAFLSGRTDGPYFYNAVYGAPLFVTVITGLLLFIVGGLLVGIAISASGRLPKWAGVSYAIAIPLFAISGFTIDIGQSFASALLTIAAVAVAWRATRSPAEDATLS